MGNISMLTIRAQYAKLSPRRSYQDKKYQVRNTAATSLSRDLASLRWTSKENYPKSMRNRRESRVQNGLNPHRYVQRKRGSQNNRSSRRSFSFKDGGELSSRSEHLNSATTLGTFLPTHHPRKKFKGITQRPRLLLKRENKKWCEISSQCRRN